MVRVLSQMDIISLPNNTLVAAFNDSPSKRTPLRLATSTDGGRTWIRNALIEDDPEGSFHYPALLYDAKKVSSLAQGFRPAPHCDASVGRSMYKRCRWCKTVQFRS